MKGQKIKLNIFIYVVALLFSTIVGISLVHQKNTSGIVYVDYGCGSQGTSAKVKDAFTLQTSINFGCKGNNCNPIITTDQPPKVLDTKYCGVVHNPIVDLLFAVVKFLSDGIGLIIVASVIIGGIQYMVSQGDPNATQMAVKRLTSAILALIVFIFAYAILNYVVPAGFFKQ